MTAKILDSLAAAAAAAGASNSRHNPLKLEKV